MLFIGGCNSFASIRQAHTSNNLKRPLRILLVTTSYPLQEGNPSGIFVKRLADALGRDDSLTVLTPASRATLQHIAAPPTVVECFRYAPKSWQRLAHEPGGIPVALKQAPWLWLLVPAFLVSMTLSTLRHGRNADVIHANWAMPGLICGIVGKMLGKPVITTLRGSDGSNLEHDVFKRSLINLVFKLNARIVTVSAPMQAMLYRLFPEYGEHCLHIPNGVDSQFLALTLPTATPQKLRLISIGSLIPRKNVKSIITALQGLPATVTLTVVGEGPEQAALARLTQELGLSQRVTFAGNVAPANIPNALA
ncbi:MAG: glycosyltransferase, partial [Azovibrio sp.]|nr:glycosyltransferase [Azovibrio sp.]